MVIYTEKNLHGLSPILGPTPLFGDVKILGFPEQIRLKNFIAARSMNEKKSDQPQNTRTTEFSRNWRLII